MKIFEAELKLFLLKNISAENYMEKIAALIDKSLMKSAEMKKFHQNAEFKGYVFNGFYPIEKVKYSAGNIYNVKIRTIDKNLMTFFSSNLQKVRTEEIQALTMTYKLLPEKHITKIYSITPMICKFEDGYWKNTNNINNLEKKLKKNAINKFNHFVKDKLDENADIFKKITLLNKYPIIKKYKNIRLLCDKTELEIEENETAQKLAKIIVGCGLAEMNARGFGFVNAKVI